MIGRALSFEDYQRLDEAINWSTLKNGRASMRRLRHLQKNPRPPSDAMDLGTAAHTATFEPREFALRFYVLPDVDLRTVKGKETAARAREANPGKIGLSRAEYDAAWNMGERLRTDPLTAPYFAHGGQAERVIEWTDPITKMRCRARLDWLPNDKRMVWSGTLSDLKSARSIEYNVFASQAERLGYFGQLEWYGWGLECVTGERPELLFLVVENTAPHDVAAFDLDPDDLGELRAERESLLIKYEHARRTDTWSGRYDTVQTLRRPRWAMSDEESTAVVTAIEE